MIFKKITRTVCAVAPRFAPLFAPGHCPGLAMAIIDRENARGRPHHLYRHWDAEGQLLYVGMSVSALARLAQHAHQSHWFDAIAVVTIESFATRKEAEEAELAAITSERPRWNTRHILDAVMADYDGDTKEPGQCRAKRCEAYAAYEWPWFCERHFALLSDETREKLAHAYERILHPPRKRQNSGLVPRKWLEQSYRGVEYRAARELALLEETLEEALKDTAYAAPQIKASRRSLYRYCRDLLYGRRKGAGG